MFITTALLSSCNACQEGIDWFNTRFPNGVQFLDGIEIAKQENPKWAQYAEELISDPKAIVMVGGYTLQAEYKVSQILCQSLEEATRVSDERRITYPNQNHEWVIRQKIISVDGIVAWISINASYYPRG